MSDIIHARSYEQGYKDGIASKNECTLRDQLAMAALTGMITCKSEGSWLNFSKWAYICADAMLEAREKEGSDA